MIRRTLGLLSLALVAACPQFATAQSSCLVTSASSTLVDFGVYTMLQGQQDGTGTLALTCVPDLLMGATVSYSVALGPGNGNGGNFFPRMLRSGAGALRYNLYLDPSRTIVWGDASAGTSIFSGSCVGVCNLTIYGRIDASQAPPSGQYSDDILITVEFN